MEGIEAIHKALMELFPEAIPTGVSNINQGGVFLLFERAKPYAPKCDVCSFSLLVAARSLKSDKDATLPKLDELRERIASKGVELFGKDIYRGITLESFENSLYIYAITLEVESYLRFNFL